MCCYARPIYETILFFYNYICSFLTAGLHSPVSGTKGIVSVHKYIFTIR